MIAVRDVLETKTIVVALTPPKVTLIPVTNPVPVIVIAVPPAGKPPIGEIEVTVGAGA